MSPGSEPSGQPPGPPEQYGIPPQPTYQQMGAVQPPAGPARSGSSPLVLAGGLIAVASLVATAVFTGLMYSDQPDTVTEFEKQHRLSTCAYAHQDPDSWGDNTEGLNCHELYNMPQAEWEKRFGEDYEDNDD